MFWMNVVCVHVFQSPGSAKLWLPNARLAAEPLPNVSRSEKRWEGFKVLFRFSSVKTNASDVPFSARKAQSCGCLNARLAAEPLPNVSRSENRWEGFNFFDNLKLSHVLLRTQKLREAVATRRQAGGCCPARFQQLKTEAGFQLCLPLLGNLTGRLA